MKEAIGKVKEGSVRRAGDFMRGFKAPFQGIAYMFQNPSTLKYALPPVPIVGVLLAGVLYMVLTHNAEVISWLWSRPVGDAWYVVWLLKPLWHLVYWLLTLVMVVVGLVVTSAVALPLAGPFMELLSEKVEAIETGYEAPFSWRVTFFNMGISLLHVGIFTTVGLIITLIGFLVGFIPVVGQIVAAAVGLTIVPIMLAFTPLDYPMTVRLWPFADKVRLVWRHLPIIYGFALATYLFLYVPVLNLFLLPACVVAATRFILMLEAEERLGIRDRRKEVLALREAQRAAKFAQGAAPSPERQGAPPAPSVSPEAPEEPSAPEQATVEEDATMEETR